MIRSLSGPQSEPTFYLSDQNSYLMHQDTSRFQNQFWMRRYGDNHIQFIFLSFVMTKTYAHTWVTFRKLSKLDNYTCIGFAHLLLNPFLDTLYFWLCSQWCLLNISFSDSLCWYIEIQFIFTYWILYLATLLNTLINSNISSVLSFGFSTYIITHQ